MSDLLNFPKYAKLGIEGPSVKLDESDDRVRGRATYRRNPGEWVVYARFNERGVPITVGGKDRLRNCQGVILHACSETEWAIENQGEL